MSSSLFIIVYLACDVIHPSPPFPLPPLSPSLSPSPSLPSLSLLPSLPPSLPLSLPPLYRYISRFRRESKMKSEAAYYFTQMVSSHHKWQREGEREGEREGLLQRGITTERASIYMCPCVYVVCN